MDIDATLTATFEDGAVRLTFTVTNTGEDALGLEFSSGQTADFTVTGEGVDWRWSDGRMVTQALRTERLAPGESLTEAATWEPPAAGEYTVRATLEAAAVDCSAATAVEVP